MAASAISALYIWFWILLFTFCARLIAAKMAGNAVGQAIATIVA